MTEGKKKTRSIILYAVFIILTVLAVGYTAYDEFAGKDTQLKEIVHMDIDSKYILIAFVCFFLAIFCEGMKYVILLHGCGSRHKYVEGFETGILGRFYDKITPLGVGGQPFQMYYLHKEGEPVGVAGAVPTAGFITSQLAFSLVVFIAFLAPVPEGITFSARILSYIGLACYLFLPAAIIFFAISPSVCMKLCGFFIKLFTKMHIIKDPESAYKKTEDSLAGSCESLKAIGKNRLSVCLSLVFAVLYQIFIFLLPFFVLKGFRAKVSLIDAIIMCSYVYSSVAIVPTPGNSGAAELSFYALFACVGSESLFFAMLIWRLLSYYMFIVVGVIIYAKRVFKRKRQRKQRKNVRLKAS